MRLAGTAKQYSKKAMPQEIRIAIHIAQPGRLRWPYQAQVIRMLLPMSISGGRKWLGVMAAPWGWPERWGQGERCLAPPRFRPAPLRQVPLWQSPLWQPPLWQPPQQEEHDPH